MATCLLPARPIRESTNPSIDAWYFSQDEAGRWKWLRKSNGGEVLRESSFAFHSFNACIDDAQRSGYSRSFAIPV